MEKFLAMLSFLFSANCLAVDDASVTRLLARAGQHVQILHRGSVHPELDLVVAFGAPWPGAWWGEKSLLGLFLQNRNRPELVYQLAIEAGQLGGDGDCHIGVERATATDVVISCTPEKGNLRNANHKFIYDIRAKSLTARLDYEPFAFRRVTRIKDGLSIIGTDSKETMTVQYRPDLQNRFRILKGGESEVSPRKLNRRLPKSTFEQFAKARPERVKNGYTRAASGFEELIGPWQLVDGTLWFGKTFYDGEGITGIGGFGFFDAQKEKYRIYSPSEIADWSVTAILVEADAIWLGLASHGEYASNSGGLLRFDRATEKVDKLKLVNIVNTIARTGDALVIATGGGFAILENGTLTRYLLDRTSDGRLRVVEAL